MQKFICNKNILFYLHLFVWGSLVLGCNRVDTQDVRQPLLPDAPEFLLSDLNGNLVKLSDFSGKLILLNFWTTWCPPCRIEIPGFIKMYNEFKNRGFMVIGISLDGGNKSIINQFVKEFDIHYPILIGNEKVVSDYGGITKIPTTFIINKDGKIVQKFIGYHKEEELRKEIQRWLTRECKLPVHSGK